MNRALVTAFLRQRLDSPLRLVLLALGFVSSLGFVALTASPSPAQYAGYWFALILTAGAIGQDVSSGVLQLTFARPLTRTAYVVSRWAGAGGAAAALGVVHAVLAGALVAVRGAPITAADVAALALQDVTLALACAAVVVLLSALVNGLGDLAVYLALGLTLVVSGAIAQARGWTVVGVGLHEVYVTLMYPEMQPHFSWLTGHGAPLWAELAMLASTITLCLALAIVAVNRKELSYATG